MVPLFSFETNFVKKITGYANYLTGLWAKRRQPVVRGFSLNRFRLKSENGIKKGRSHVDRPSDVGGKQLHFLRLGVTQIYWVTLIRKGGGRGKNAVLHCFPRCGSAGWFRTDYIETWIIIWLQLWAIIYSSLDKEKLYGDAIFLA